MLRVFKAIGTKGTTIRREREITQSAHWTRDTQNFKFAHYWTKRISVNNDLNKYDTNVDGASQVQAFLRGIKADAATNPHSLGIKTTILTDANTKDNIYGVVVTFKDTVRNLGVMSTASKSMRISASYREGKCAGRIGDDWQNYRSENSFIPNEILKGLPAKYRVMVFKRRDDMESNNKSNADRSRSVNCTTS